MRASDRWCGLVFVIVVSMGTSACAALRTTLAQERARERWQMCEGRVPDVRLKEIRPDGQISFTYSSPSAKAGALECLKEAFEVQRTRPVTSGANVAVSPAPAPESGSAAVVVALPETPRAPMPPIWKIGDEWAYRYNASGAGTYVWAVVRVDTVDGAECYVVKSGSRELFYRTRDLAIVRETVDGAVVRRDNPPAPQYKWPLTTGTKWEHAYTFENARDRQTSQRQTSWEVQTVEDVTVPAGTFRAFKISSSDLRTGRPIYEMWYAPDAKQWIKIREWLESGERRREMTEYKLR